MLVFAFSSPIYTKISLECVLFPCLLSSFSSITKPLFVIENIFIFPDIFPFVALHSESDHKKKWEAWDRNFIPKGVCVSYLLAYTCQHVDEQYV